MGTESWSRRAHELRALPACWPSSHSGQSDWRRWGRQAATSRTTCSSHRVLLKDGDLKIANNYERQDYLEYWRGSLHPHYSRPGVNGEQYSGHAPGLPALIAPAFAIGGYWGTVAWIGLLGALGSMFVWQSWLHRHA